MKQEHHPWAIHTFGNKANTEESKEFLGMNDQGVYVDSRNGRPTSVVGNTGDHEKINGEAVLYPAPALPGTWFCAGSISINRKLVEFWVETNGAQPALCRVDGVVVLQSVNFDIVYSHPLQLDRNENVSDGQVFATDQRVPPFILDIKDMQDSLISDPTKYFQAFNFELYQVNESSPLDTIAFIKLENVGGGGGMPPGAYEYQMRYASKEGDRTNWCHRSVMISVPRALSNSSAQYPWSKTYGSNPDPSSKTGYGIRLRFRVTNIYNYDFIEIKRLSHNQGAGIGFTPQPFLIAAIPISNGEISIKEFLDPVEANDVVAISATEDTRELAHVEWAKAIRYFDKRTVLMNVKLASKEASLIFNEVNGKKMFPIIDKLGTSGFNDPWNMAHRKSYMGGERYGFGVELFDGVGGEGYVTKVPGFGNYQYPNRRAIADADTKLYSTGTVRAATTSNTVDQTFEVFDHADAVKKTDKCSFKNIMRADGASISINKPKIAINEDCNETSGAIINHGAHVSLLDRVTPYYHPYTPVRDNDANVEGHNYWVNTKASHDGSEDDSADYQPKGFGPNYYSHGMCLAGITNIPKWVKAFVPVRTNAAKRVIAQGIGMYSISPAEFDLLGNAKLVTKETKKFWFFSPDIENGIVSSDTVNDIIANPEGYSLQFVSPLGFFSEINNFEYNTFPTEPAARDTLIDIMSYARMIRDNGDINPNEDAGMGIDGADGYRYVAFDRWRNVGTQSSAFTGGAGGDNLFNLIAAARISEGRGTYMSIQTDTDIYATVGTGGTTHNDFDDSGMKDFHEPFFIVNIVADGAIINDENIEKYKSTGQYQKIESIIGQATGVAGQKFLLVDERYDDAIPALSSTDPNSSTDRFIYIKKVNGTVQQWVNITYKTGAQIATIIADIASVGYWQPTLGVQVTGMYTHNILENGRFFEIVLSQTTPDPKDLILIRYDDTAPLKFYGGDTVVGESLFAPIDREADANDNASDTQFAMGIGWPYRVWKMNPRVYIVKRTTGVNKIQDHDWLNLGYIRQMCMMFTVESRAAVHLAHNDAYPLQYFPLINYVIRPNRWDKDKGIEEQYVYKQYVSDYGESEKDQWKYGGFRFKQNINPDYSNEPPIEFFSKPEVGFVDKTEFPTRTMWSLPRAINAQNIPGNKTFPANNSYDADDDQGEIKRAWEATTDHGENLYAITNKGVLMFVTKKSILSQVDGNDVAFMASDSFIKSQLWLSKDIGMYDEMWKSAAEANVLISTDASGTGVFREALFFAGNKSVYRLMDNQVADIGRTGYYNSLYQEALKFVLPGYGSLLAGGFDELHQEYWFQFISGNSDIPDQLFVFNQKNNGWTGRFDYRFDSYTTQNNIIYGHRGLETYELGTGYTMNGSPIQYELLGASAKEKHSDKEFIRIRVNSSNKPVDVEFLEVYKGPVVSRLNVGQGSLYMKNYRGWEQFVSRKLASIDPARSRVQGRVILYRVIHNLPEDFRVSDIGLQYKVLK